MYCILTYIMYIFPAVAVNVEASCDNSTLALANTTECLDAQLQAMEVLEEREKQMICQYR